MLIAGALVYTQGACEVTGRSYSATRRRSAALVPAIEIHPSPLERRCRISSRQFMCLATLYPKASKPQMCEKKHTEPTKRAQVYLPVPEGGQMAHALRPYNLSRLALNNHPYSSRRGPIASLRILPFGFQAHQFSVLFILTIHGVPGANEPSHTVAVLTTLHGLHEQSNS